MSHTPHTGPPQKESYDIVNGLILLLTSIGQVSSQHHKTFSEEDMCHTHHTHVLLRRSPMIVNGLILLLTSKGQVHSPHHRTSSEEDVHVENSKLVESSLVLKACLNCFDISNNCTFFNERNFTKLKEIYNDVLVKPPNIYDTGTSCRFIC